ncbi:hypothetical protein LTR84_012686 [Exophiala bonariae]|uniref:Major facilitator superfamily (MFS) profile domain-containing protein n=1 Tax=Exophiala bonariae TaxID=1690606 RepID=A0AAV9NEN4_9EURO|nr:hypothetical protein LTR84_012686 [Exophiala bonariae]
MSPTASPSMDNVTEMTTSEKAQSLDPVDEYEDAEKNYKPKSIKFLSIMIAMYMSFFLVGLVSTPSLTDQPSSNKERSAYKIVIQQDRLIIAAAIPRITDEFDSIQDIGWYGSGYMLTAACFMLISGRVYQLYSTKWTFLASVALFEVGSAICGAAPNSTSFIIGRAIAGLASAGVYSGGTMIILPLVPLRKRPVFTSFFGLVFGVSSVLGPIAGGAFTDHVSWRWCFYINLPIGGVTMLVIFFFLHIEAPKREKLSIFNQIKRLDPIGVFFFIPSIVCLTLALQWAGTTYSWSNPKIIGLLVTFAVLFICFIIVEILTPETAMAPMRVVLNRSMAGSMFFMLLIAGSMMSAIYYLTIWFQAAKSLSATKSGTYTLPLILTFIVIGIVSAVATQKIGYYIPAMFISVILCSTGAGMLSTLSAASSPSAYFGYQVLYGCGIGFGFQTSMLPAQNVLSRADVPLGMALMFFMQQLGGSIFIAVGQTIFSNRLVRDLSGIGGLDATTIVNTGATDLHTSVPENQLPIVIDAYSNALTRVFLLAAGLSAAMILGVLAVEWKKMDGKKKVVEQEVGGQKSVDSDNGKMAEKVAQE